MREKLLRKLQLEELEILKEFLKICKKYEIKYYMLGGTFLGAVRHKGFIPWDDDIDIGIPRKDYEKFIKIIDKELPIFLKFKNFKKDRDVNVYFSRIESERIKLYDNSAIIKKVERKAWMDIFPLDGMPDNIILRNIHKIRLLILRVKLQYSLFSVLVNQSLPNRPIHEKILIEIGKIFPFEKFLKKEKFLCKLDILLTKYEYDKSKYIVNFSGIYKFKEMFPKKIYDEISEYEFEDLKLIGPKNYDFVLKQLYGDYMKLPPENERNKHNTEMIDN